jgi:futalosine hydrolase
MERRVLLVFATSSEAEILEKISGMIPFEDGFRFGNSIISTLVTGVGGISIAWSMKQWLSINPKPDLAINAGIAGSFSDKLKIGEVVIPVTDCFADMGIESGDKMITLYEAGLSDPDLFPFEKGVINSRNEFINKLGQTTIKVNAITVNMCSGSAATIEKLKNKFNPDIETMEGATFFYICAREKIPFLAVRAISNKVEPRSKETWNVPFALENLTGKMKEILLTLD